MSRRKELGYLLFINIAKNVKKIFGVFLVFYLVSDILFSAPTKCPPEVFEFLSGKIGLIVSPIYISLLIALLVIFFVLGVNEKNMRSSPRWRKLFWIFVPILRIAIPVMIALQVPPLAISLGFTGGKGLDGWIVLLATFSYLFFSALTKIFSEEMAQHKASIIFSVDWDDNIRHAPVARAKELISYSKFGRPLLKERLFSLKNNRAHSIVSIELDEHLENWSPDELKEFLCVLRFTIEDLIRSGCVVVFYGENSGVLVEKFQDLIGDSALAVDKVDLAWGCSF